MKIKSFNFKLDNEKIRSFTTREYEASRCSDTSTSKYVIKSLFSLPINE